MTREPRRPGLLPAEVEKALKDDAERRFWRCFERSFVPMLVADRDRRVRRVNRAGRLLLGSSRAEVAGAPLAGALDIARRPELRTSATTAPWGDLVVAFVPREWPRDELRSEPLHATLSPRELQTLQGVVAGLTTAEIATDLGIAQPTVNAHLASAQHRLGARTRAEAVAIACHELMV